MKAIRKVLRVLARSAALLLLLGAMMVLGGIFEGSLCPLPGFCVLALLAAGLCGLAGVLRALSSPARPKRAVPAACPRPCKRRRQGLRVA